MHIYTIIVTYNGRHWVDFCLGSLRKSSVKTIPLVIDNHSTDETQTYIREQYPEALLFPQERNLGFGQANNVGLRYAMAHNADYMLLLNQDAAIAPDAIELMLAQSDGNSLLSPIHMNGGGNSIDHNFRNSTLIKCSALLNDLFAGTVHNTYPAYDICAACWLLPRKVVEQIGGFNPLFFHYSEDTNYLQRLQYHHIDTLLVPQARMYHDRKEFGNKQMWNAQWLYNNLMLSYTNINLSRRDRINMLLRTLFTCYTSRLRNRQYHIGAFSVAWTRVLIHMNRIRQSRNKEQQINTNWL